MRYTGALVFHFLYMLMIPCIRLMQAGMIGIEEYGADKVANAHFQPYASRRLLSASRCLTVPHIVLPNECVRC